jgi:SAM-dependent methyltransferase
VTTCIVCQSDRLRRRFDYVVTHDPSRPLFGGRAIAECDGCGLLQVDPVPEQAQLDSYYRDTYRSDGAWSDIDLGTFPFDNTWYLSRGRSLRLFVDELAALPSDGHPRLLDIGAGFGHVLYAFREGHPEVELTAAEPDPHCAPFLQRCGAELVQTQGDGTRDIEALQRRGPFDLLLLTHVLEHLRDPVGSLRRLAQLLGSTGVLALEVPNCPARYHRQWAHVPHVSFFDGASLRCCIEAAGGRALAIRTCGPHYEHGEQLRRLLPPFARRAIGRTLHAARSVVRRGGTAAAMPAGDFRRDVNMLPEPVFGEYGGEDRFWLRALVRF